MILLYFEYPRPVYCKRFHFGESDNHGLFGKIRSFGHTVYKWILNTLTFLVDIIIGPPCNAKVKFQRIKTLSFVWNEMEYYNKNQNQKNQKSKKYF